MSRTTQGKTMPPPKAKQQSQQQQQPANRAAAAATPTPSGSRTMKTENTYEQAGRSDPLDVELLQFDEKVPVFLLKLWHIVNDEGLQEIVGWDESGFSFRITDPYTFSHNVLPQYFKHSNMNSLVRQLNMYGFRKLTALERNSLARLESDQDYLEFSHPYFVRDQPELLPQIKRKTASSSSQGGMQQDGAGPSGRAVQTVLDEVKQLRDRQFTMDGRLQHMMKENQALWREVAQMRSLHMKQQQVVNKLIQFLISVVQPGQRRIGRRNLLSILPNEEVDGGYVPNAAAASSSSSTADVDMPGTSYQQKPANSGTNFSRKLQMDRRATETLSQLQRELSANSPGSSGQMQNTDGSMTITDVTDEPDHHASAASPGASNPVVNYTVDGSQMAQSPMGPGQATSPVQVPPQQQPPTAYPESVTFSEGLMPQQSAATGGPQHHHMFGAPSFGLGEPIALDELAGQNSGQQPLALPNNEHCFTRSELHDFLSGVDLSLDHLKDDMSKNTDFDPSALTDLFADIEQSASASSAGVPQQQQRPVGVGKKRLATGQPLAEGDRQVAIYNGPFKQQQPQPTGKTPINVVPPSPEPNFLASPVPGEDHLHTPLVQHGQQQPRFPTPDQQQQQPRPPATKKRAP